VQLGCLHCRTIARTHALRASADHTNVSTHVRSLSRTGASACVFVVLFGGLEPAVEYVSSKACTCVRAHTVSQCMHELSHAPACPDKCIDVLNAAQCCNYTVRSPHVTKHSCPSRPARPAPLITWPGCAMTILRDDSARPSKSEHKYCRRVR
jgi:hypothetical protein